MTPEQVQSSLEPYISYLTA
nr:83 kda cationic peroxidase {N-terminal} {EC 1.11.1.7} [Araucaria araucana, seeds, Peptide Partial, 19 aa] [Araucaria araucana]